MAFSDLVIILWSAPAAEGTVALISNVCHVKQNHIRSEQGIPVIQEPIALTSSCATQLYMGNLGTLFF